MRNSVERRLGKYFLIRRACMKLSIQPVRDWAVRLSTWCEWIGVAGVIVMVAVTCADVLGAKFFLLPVPGSTEIVSLAQVATIVFAVAATQLHKGHISVEIFYMKMPPRTQALTSAVTSCLGLILFLVLIYQGIQLGNAFLAAREVTATVQIPFYPFAYGFALAIVPVALILFIDLIDALKELFN
jgi:TRAP-type C4-dicarboxylate transport system permease small subunit